jgi:integrase
MKATQDLRHTRAALPFAAGVPITVVSERVGHANATIRLGVGANVSRGVQAEAAPMFGSGHKGGAL